ncbi:flagellar hook capping FlgD N-terminal domain-containing protein [Phycisphaerales bacterium AB-hyl4]|uniref:Basal-body rod modification protein FlgD n=1 Tax=Natronomicrosphaera hydrolytica TaxID=3242702 RepID=A0ABV4U4X5_9BACT
MMDALTEMGANQASQAKAGGKNQFAELSSEEFIKNLVTELTTQDPFEPNDSAQILEQLSSLRNIESQMNLQDQLKNLVLQNQVSQASGLIGKMVRGMTDENNRVEGVVTSVRIADGKAMLELDTGQRVPMSRVETIANKQGEAASAESFGQLV